MTDIPNAKLYANFADLAAAQVEGTDYVITVRPVAGSRTAVVAPHGGTIETHTSDIARSLAGEQCNLYLFDGIRASANYRALHLTSAKFDEPRCLAMLAECDKVVTVHGYADDEPKVLLGGLDEDLKQRIERAVTDAGIVVDAAGHRFPRREPLNICNRKASRARVQLEISSGMSFSSAAVTTLVRAVRGALLPDGEQAQAAEHGVSRRTFLPRRSLPQRARRKCHSRAGHRWV